MILKITLDPSLDKRAYEGWSISKQVLYCAVKSARITDVFVYFVLESAYPAIDEFESDPFYASVTVSRTGAGKFFADYDGSAETINYIEISCSVEEVKNFPSLDQAKKDLCNSDTGKGDRNEF